MPSRPSVEDAEDALADEARQREEGEERRAVHEPAAPAPRREVLVDHGEHAPLLVREAPGVAAVLLRLARAHGDGRLGVGVSQRPGDTPHVGSMRAKSNRR